MHRLFCKFWYLLATPFVWIVLRLLGIRLHGRSWFCGFPYFSKGRGAEISLGRGCRFISKECGNLVGLNHRCILSAEDGATLKIGDRCGFSGVSIWCFREITLEDGVRVGANTTIMDGDAHLDDPRSGVPKPILIKKNAWLGANVLVLKGVTIGENSVIGAGSVVTKDIPDNVIAAGNPCRVIRSFSEETKGKLKDYLS